MNLSTGQLVCGGIISRKANITNTCSGYFEFINLPSKFYQSASGTVVRNVGHNTYFYIDANGKPVSELRPKYTLASWGSGYYDGYYCMMYIRYDGSSFDFSLSDDQSYNVNKKGFIEYGFKSHDSATSSAYFKIMLYDGTLIQRTLQSSFGSIYVYGNSGSGAGGLCYMKQQ